MQEWVELVCSFVSRKRVLEPIGKVAQWKRERRENIISSLSRTISLKSLSPIAGAAD
jgi:hypothetical protein